MKTLKSLFSALILLLIILQFSFTSCKKDDILNLNVGDTLWTYQLEKTDIHFSSTPLAVASDGTIYFAAGGNAWNGTEYEQQRVFAINKTDGSLKWKSDYLETWHINSNIVIGDDGTVYVTSAYHLYAINPSDGSFKWTWEVPQSLPGQNGDDYTYGEIGPIALAKDGSILLATCGSGSYTRKLYKISTSGSIIWHYTLYSTTANTPMSIADDGTIYKIDFFSGDDTYSLIALNPDNGALLWSTKANYNSSGYENILTADNGDVITFVQSDSLARISASTHLPVWKINISGTNSLTYDKDGNLFLFNQYDGCSVINIETGKVTASSLSLPQHPIIDENNQLYGVISDWHPHLSVTGKDGTIDWESAVDIDGNSLAVSDDKVIYFFSGDKLFALQGDAALSKYGWARVTHDNRNTFNAGKH